MSHRRTADRSFSVTRLERGTMASRQLQSAFVVLALVACVSTTFAARLDQYREFTLGGSAAAVSALTHTRAGDITTIHGEPRLLQRLTWRPRNAIGRPIPDLDPVREMVFTFIDDRLFEIAIDYEWNLTAGMTVEDMVASLERLYGPRAPLMADAGAQAFDPNSAARVVANWESGDARVLLQHVANSGGFKLLVSSIALAPAAQAAQSDAVARQRAEAPAEAATALQRQEAAARVAEEKTRAINKDRFQP
jgi:hypothetical protein